MVPIVQRWNKIVEDLQACIHIWVPKNGNMYKDKWNGLNSDYNKLLDYHKATKNHIFFWEMTTKEHDKHNLPH
jgi:hypothetical protein